MPYYCSMFVIAEAPLSLEGSPSFVDGSAPDLFYSREFRLCPPGVPKKFHEHY